MNLGERSVKILKIFLAQIAKSSCLYHTDIGGHIIPIMAIWICRSNKVEAASLSQLQDS